MQRRSLKGRIYPLRLIPRPSKARVKCPVDTLVLAPGKFIEHQCIGREMSIDLLNQKIGVELLTKATALYDESNKFFERLLLEGKTILDDENAYNDLSVSYSEFIIIKDDYLVAAQENINGVLFGEISLSELRLAHHYSMEAKKG